MFIAIVFSSGIISDPVRAYGRNLPKESVMNKEITDISEMENVTGGTGIGQSDNDMEMICPDTSCDGLIRFRIGARKVRCPKCKKVHTING